MEGWPDNPRYLSTSPASTPEIPRALGPSCQPCDFAVCFGPGGDAWAPYTPLTSEAHHHQEWVPPSVDEIYQQLRLPFNLSILDERDKTAIAYAFESRAILVAENEIAKRRVRQSCIFSRYQELDVTSMQARLRRVDENLDLAVIAALKHMYASLSLDDAENVELPEKPQQPYVLRMPSEWRQQLGVGNEESTML